MDYQVWIKDEYTEGYTKVDCVGIEAAVREIDAAIRTGAEPLLTVAVPYRVNVKIEEGKVEVKESKAKPDKVARGKSDSAVRRGDEGAAEEVGPGSGDNEPDPGAGD